MEPVSRPHERNSKSGDRPRGRHASACCGVRAAYVRLSKRLSCRPSTIMNYYAGHFIYLYLLVHAYATVMSSSWWCSWSLENDAREQRVTYDSRASDARLVTQAGSPCRTRGLCLDSSLDFTHALVRRMEGQFSPLQASLWQILPFGICAHGGDLLYYSG